MAEMDSCEKAHAIVFPYPYQGHITPTINLAIKLASVGFTITYVHTQFIHHSISKSQQAGIDLFSEARKSGLDIRYTTVSDGFPLEFDRYLYFEEYWETMFREFPTRVDEIIERTMKSSEGVSFFLIADTLYSWPAAMAEKHKLVHVSFWTEPALVFAINYHLDLLRLNGHLPYTGQEDYQVDYIPGVVSICRKQLMSHIQDPEDCPALFKIEVQAFQQVKHADFILCNTVHELEPDALSSLNQNQPIYAIGPTNFYAESSNITIPLSIWPESECKQWLNSKPDGSVLYVSFGSIATLSKTEIEEIAEGLLLTQVNFIWVLRPDIVLGKEFYSLPKGFQENMKDRGLIIPWCDQIMVLSNPATGGFLTHCGWNSVLESMWHGVPMICHPFFVDQPTNRKLVVNDWKIGIDLCDVGKITRDEVAYKIKILMRGQKSVELKKESKKISNEMQNALDKDGSSQRKFVQFVSDLKLHLYHQKKRLEP